MKSTLTLLVLFTNLALGQSSVERSKELLNQGKNVEAIAVLRNLLEATPRNIEAWRLLGEAYQRTGKLDSAEIAARRVVSIDDELPDGYIFLARVQLARKNFTDAKSTLRRGLRIKQDNSFLLTQLGEVLLAQDSLDQAIVFFSRAKEADARNAQAYEGLGDVYMKQGVPAIAIMNYEKGIEADSLRPTLYHKLARAYMKERRYTDAARTYLRAIKFDSTNTGAQLELGKLLVSARRYADAAKVLQPLARGAAPTSEVTLMHMEALFQSRQFDEAIPIAERVLKADPRSVSALRVAAGSHSELGKHETAIVEFRLLAVRDTLRGDDFRRLAKSYAETKQDSLAAVTLEQAWQLDTTDADLLGDLGAIYMGMRQYEKAAALFERRYTKDPNSVSAYVNYAMCNMALGRWEPARAALRTALSIRPQYITGRLRLGLALSQLDSLQAAKKEYEAVLAMTDTAQARYKTEIAEAHQQIGFILLRQKDYAGAIESLTRALRIKDDDPQSHLWKAQALHLTNKREEAIKEYKRVLKLDPKNEAAKKGLLILEGQ